MKFVPTVEDVIEINKKIGGYLRLDSSIDFAISSGQERTSRHKLALLWRAVLIDHPFTDGNKRTVEILTRIYAKAGGYQVDTKKLVREIVTVSSKNIDNLEEIKRRIKYVVKIHRQNNKRK